VQSDVARKFSPTTVTRNLISNSQGTVEIAPLVPIKQPTKQGICLVSTTPLCGCQAEGLSIKTSKINNLQ
jgi:hypothetical protein